MSNKRLITQFTFDAGLHAGRLSTSSERHLFVQQQMALHVQAPVAASSRRQIQCHLRSRVEVHKMRVTR